MKMKTGAGILAIMGITGLALFGPTWQVVLVLILAVMAFAGSKSLPYDKM